MSDNEDNNKTTADSEFYFVPKEGACAAAIRSYDWSDSHLGPPGLWPVSLKTALGIMLESTSPLLLWWGPEYVQFHNDALQNLIQGTDTASYGRKGFEISDIWFTVQHAVKEVMHQDPRAYGGRRSSSFRAKAYGEDTELNFSYSPAFGDTGAVEGVLAAVRGSKTLINMPDGPYTDDAMHQSILEKAEFGILCTQGPDHRVTFANEKYIEISAQRPMDLPGRPLPEFIAGCGINMYALIRSVRERGGSVTLSAQLISGIGTTGETAERFFNVTCQPYKYKSVDGLMFFFNEVTDIFLSKRESEHLAHQTRALVAGAPFPIGVTSGSKCALQWPTSP